jgi:hypothetical protein
MQLRTLFASTHSMRAFFFDMSSVPVAERATLDEHARRLAFDH